MSDLTDELTDAAAEVEGAAGEPFTFEGATKYGVFSAVDSEGTFGDVSIRERVRFRVSTTRAQWSAEPRDRAQVTYNGTVYRIVGRAGDGVNYLLDLAGIT